MANNISDFKQILINSQASNNAIRSDNESKIKQIRDQNSVNFIQMLMMVVNHSGSTDDDTKARQLASILFKNTLYLNVFQDGHLTSMNNSVWF